MFHATFKGGTLLAALLISTAAHAELTADQAAAVAHRCLNHVVHLHSVSHPQPKFAPACCGHLDVEPAEPASSGHSFER